MEHVRLGWVEIIDSLKSLLETGEPMPSVDTTESGSGAGNSAGGIDGNTAAEITGGWHRQQAIEANNSVWDLLGDSVTTGDQVDDLLGRAYAAAYHWARASGTSVANAARASWLLSRCCAVVGHAEVALHHADQCMAAVRSGELADFDLAYAHEARARSLAALGRTDEALAERHAAMSTVVVDPDDRSIFESDAAAEPWFGLSTSPADAASTQG